MVINEKIQVARCCALASRTPTILWSQTIDNHLAYLLELPVDTTQNPEKVSNFGQKLDQNYIKLQKFGLKENPVII